MKNDVKILLSIVKTCIEDMNIQADMYDECLRYEVATELRARATAYAVILKEMET